MDLFRLNQVQGLITQAEGERLYDLAADVPSWAAIVEVGSHTGRSTLYLASGTTEGWGAHVTAVDPWPEPGYTAHYEDCKSDDDPFDFQTGQAVMDAFILNVTTAEAWPAVTVLRGLSLDIAKVWVNPVGLLFLDAMHGFDDVRADCEAWLPKVTQGGVAALHDWFDDEDYSHESQVADALHATWNPDEWEELPIVDNLWSAVRR